MGHFLQTKTPSVQELESVTEQTHAWFTMSAMLWRLMRQKQSTPEAMHTHTSHPRPQTHRWGYGTPMLHHRSQWDRSVSHHRVMQTPRGWMRRQRQSQCKARGTSVMMLQFGWQPKNNVTFLIISYKDTLLNHNLYTVLYPSRRIIFASLLYSYIEDISICRILDSIKGHWQRCLGPRFKACTFLCSCWAQAPAGHSSDVMRG